MEYNRGKNSQPRYDLGTVERERIVRDCLPEQERDRTGVNCYLVPHNSALTNVARSLEREVFERAFGNDDECMGQEYGPYEDSSRFFVSIDAATQTPVGVLRIIENGSNGLKTLNDIADSSRVPQAVLTNTEEVLAYHGIDNLNECIDIGTVAVQPEYRKTHVPTQLYRAMYKYAVKSNKKHMVSAIDTRPLSRMTQYLGIPFVPLAGTPPCEYLGSASTQFVYAYVPDMYPKMRGRMLTYQGMLALKHSFPLVLGSGDRKIHSLQEDYND